MCSTNQRRTIAHIVSVNGSTGVGKANRAAATNAGSSAAAACAGSRARAGAKIKQKKRRSRQSQWESLILLEAAASSCGVKVQAPRASAIVWRPVGTKAELQTNAAQKAASSHGDARTRRQPTKRANGGRALRTSLSLAKAVKAKNIKNGFPHR